MAIDQFNVKGVGPFKAEYDAPVGPHGHGPKSLQVAFQRMQAIPGDIESLRRGGAIENGEDSFNRLQKVARIPLRSSRS